MTFIPAVNARKIVQNKKSPAYAQVIKEIKKEITRGGTVIKISPFSYGPIKMTSEEVLSLERLGYKIVIEKGVGPYGQGPTYREYEDYIISW